MYLRVASGRTEAIQYPVQTINPEGYLTGFNETMAESAFHWQDDSRNFIKRADIQKLFDASIGHEEARLDRLASSSKRRPSTKVVKSAHNSSMLRPVIYRARFSA